MSFSDSFALGDNTLQELEKGIIKTVPKAKSNFITPPTRKRKAADNKNVMNNNRNNATSEMNLYRHDEFIDESPTDKTSSTNKSIRERLRTSSRSSAKKRDLNRSKSEPLTPKHKNVPSLSVNDFGSMFDSTMDFAGDDQQPTPNNQDEKPNESKDQNIFSESIGKYFQGSADCFTQIREAKENLQPAASNGSDLNENISQFFQSQFTLETADRQVNVSALEELLKTQRSLLTSQHADSSSDDLFTDINEVNAAGAHISFHETDNIQILAPNSDVANCTMPTTQNMSKIVWDESDFFDDLNYGVTHDNAEQEPIENVFVNENIVLDGSIRENLDASIVLFIDDEIESCKIDVSSALNEEHQSQAPICVPSQYVEVHSLAPIKTNAAVSVTTHERQLPVSTSTSHDKDVDMRDMANLTRWGISRIILEEYKKKGIRRMFDWQAECLSNTKVRNEAKNLVYSAPTSAGKTFVSEILMMRNVIENKKRTLIILPFISVVREKMYALQVNQPPIKCPQSSLCTFVCFYSRICFDHPEYAWRGFLVAIRHLVDSRLWTLPYVLSKRPILSSTN